MGLWLFSSIEPSLMSIAWPSVVTRTIRGDLDDDRGGVWAWAGTDQSVQPSLLAIAWIMPLTMSRSSIKRGEAA